MDMKKASDKVWPKGFTSELKQNGMSGKLLRFIKNFLSDRKQSVVLNGQCSSWMDVQAVVPPGFILGSLPSLIYINDLADNLTSNPKLFAEDMSLFSTVTDPNAMANQINNDLDDINTRAHQWKMNFNPDTTKQAQQVIFSCKSKVPAHPQLVVSATRRSRDIKIRLCLSNTMRKSLI